MYKVAYNSTYGGWSLCDYHIEWLREKGLDEETIEAMDLGYYELRCHPLLIECLEHFPQSSDISLYEVGDGFGYCIFEYDGAETVITNHPKNFIFNTH